MLEATKDDVGSGLGITFRDNEGQPLVYATKLLIKKLFIISYYKTKISHILTKSMHILIKKI